MSGMSDLYKNLRQVKSVEEVNEEQVNETLFDTDELHEFMQLYNNKALYWDNKSFDKVEKILDKYGSEDDDLDKLFKEASKEDQKEMLDILRNIKKEDESEEDVDSVDEAEEMDIDEMISKLEDAADFSGNDDGMSAEYKQIAKWLKELKIYREEDQVKED